MFTKPSRKIHRVLIHCTASDYPHHDNIDTIRSWHLNRAFSDVGYHFFIQKDGTLEYGRDIEKTPAAQKGHNYENVSFHGHCEISKKACPVFNYREVLDLDKYRSLHKNGTSLYLLKRDKADDLPDLKLGSRGEAVELLQQLLFIKIDGIFGPQTSRSVKAFKKSHDLYSSDIVKSYVWKLLMNNKKM